MVTPLPTQFDPRKFAEQARQLRGLLLLAPMSRLTEMVGAQSGEIELELGFGRDEGGFPFMNGSASMTLKLICQRCLSEMLFPLVLTFKLSPVATEEEAKALPATYEALLLPRGEELVLAEMIEDELILGLPLAPKHADPGCNANLAALTVKTEKVSPFAVLKQKK